MFDNGELDILQPSGDYAAKYRSEVESGQLQTLVTDYPATIGFLFNSKDGGPSGVAGNAKIRKAIAYSIDREEMVDAVYGRYKPAYSYVAPAITFDGTSYRSQAEAPMESEYAEYANDSEKLQALFQEGLDELGITTPISEINLTFLTYGTTVEYNSGNEYIQQVIQKKLGCKVTLNAVGESALFRSERDNYNYDFMYSGWYSDYNDPLDFLYTFYTNAYGETNYGGYSNAKYDALIDSLTGENDDSKRFEIYQQLEDILLLEDCEFVPIYHLTKEYFLQKSGRSSYGV
jgi:ABC-type oligopeptide transport system substrate-binding subunit